MNKTIQHEQKDNQEQDKEQKDKWQKNKAGKQTKSTRGPTLPSSGGRQHPCGLMK